MSEEAPDIAEETIEEVISDETPEQEIVKHADHITDLFIPHGGDPRELDLGRSLLVSRLPSSFLNDSIDVFSECVQELLVEEYKIQRESIEKIIRIPKLLSDDGNNENSLRAIVLFKSRVHKHRVIAQKRLATLDGSLIVSQLDDLPADILDLADVEISDEIGDDDNAYAAYDNVEDHVQLDEEDDEDIKEEALDEKSTASTEKTSENKNEETKSPSKAPESNNEPKKEESDSKKDPKKEIKEAKSEKKEAKKEEKKERPKKAYIDEDLKAPFEVSWEGAPEFQWKICSLSGDARQLTLENVSYQDLQNPFIYRVMVKAEKVDISLPQRYLPQGTKQQYGKMVLLFQHPVDVMHEAVRHLIYMRCPDGRRIKVYLPQTSQTMKMKDELEEKLGRLIKPTPRMHQLVIKVLPKEEYTISDAKSWFPQCSDQITDWEQIEDEIGQHVGIVTFANTEAVVRAHSLNAFLYIATSTDKTAKVQVFMRGVEAHFGSLLTRWDQKKAREFYGESPKAERKRNAETRPNNPPKRGRHAPAPRSSRGTPRGGYSSTGGRPYPSFRGPIPAPFVPSRDDSYGRRNDGGERGWRVNQYPSAQRYGLNDPPPPRFGLPFNNYASPRRDTYPGGNYGRR